MLLSKPRSQSSHQFAMNPTKTTIRHHHNRITRTLEKQIDQLVYALYGLTAAEIAIIEKQE